METKTSTFSGKIKQTLYFFGSAFQTKTPLNKKADSSKDDFLMRWQYLGHTDIDIGEYSFYICFTLIINNETIKW